MHPLVNGIHHNNVTYMHPLVNGIHHNSTAVLFSAVVIVVMEHDGPLCEEGLYYVSPLWALDWVSYRDSYFRWIH